ncbi:MAG: serine--tRNA ligase [Patescibacteria group bacterium]|nr:serine--tRNA ligase [Patescibacteria group bacterium]
MIDIDLIRKQPEKVAEGLRKRGKDTSLLESFKKLDDTWRELIKKSDEIRAQQKKAAQDRDQEKGRELKEQLKKLEENVTELERERYILLLEFPNIPFDDVLVGPDESHNKQIRFWKEKPEFDFPIKDHMELGEALDIIDTQKAAHVAGSRFYYLKGKGALLELALVQYAFETLTKEGFEAIIPPVMIRPDTYERMGRLTDSQKEERYYLPKDDLYLVGSAEHTLGPLHMDETFMPDQLPKEYVGFSTCFRREAGTYGKDTKGILRVHQFDKVEMYAFCTPEKSEDEHKKLLSMQEKLFQGLEIPYEVVEICTGDMGPTDARQFDVNAWIPSQQTYREVASCSNTTDYQTRGINTKVKTVDGKTQFAHALNATALAMSRTIIAILENYQQKDGSVIIPQVLQKYTGFNSIV